MPFQTIFFSVVLGILAAVFVLQLFKRPLIPKIIRYVFWFSAFLVLAYLSYLSYLQYQAFSQGPLKFTLGTWDGLKWFFGYVRLHFWNEYLVSLPIGVIFALVANFFNQKYGERFFWKEELYLMALGILLTGYPGFLFYIILVLALAAIISAIFLKKGERLPLYYLWLPGAIAIVISVHFWAIEQTWWSSFRF